MRSFGAVTVALVAALVVIAAGCSSSGSQAGHSTSPARAISTTSTLVGAEPSSGCHSVTPGAVPTTTVFSSVATFDGQQRSAVVAANGLRADRPAPVVVLLHGMGQDAQKINQTSGFPARAEKVGTIVVTPNAVGSPTMWRPSGTGPDAEYITWLLDKVSTAYCVDRARVYLAGFSVGAVMATSYACAHQDLIAAVATVSVQFPGSCTKPLSIIGFHGSDDPIVPFAAGAKGAIGGGAGTVANMGTWAKLGGCNPHPIESKAAAKVTEYDWPGCTGSAQVTLYRIDGGVHAWPGTLEGGDAVPPGQSVDATARSLAFFARHHR